MTRCYRSTIPRHRSRHEGVGEMVSCKGAAAMKECLDRHTHMRYHWDMESAGDFVTKLPSSSKTESLIRALRNYIIDSGLKPGTLIMAEREMAREDIEK